MSGYFETLSDVLMRDGQMRPCIVVDLDRLERNIDRAAKTIRDSMDARLVAKSLHSLDIIRMASKRLATTRVMTFSDTMLIRMLAEAPEFEHLLGKPFPVPVAEAILAAWPEAAKKVLWLIDSHERLREYDALARRLSRPLKIALEVNIGLNRGGFAPKDFPGLPAELAKTRLRPAGVMGYEAHLAKLPGPLAALEARRVTRRIRAASALAHEICARPIVNLGGSLTFGRYGPESGGNEVAFGSILVKPGDFDTPATRAFEPAAFIATPILKYLPENLLPGLGRWRGRVPGIAPAQIAIWGGYWPARPVWPEGYRRSRIFGHSSNQEVWSGPRLTPEQAGGLAFLRPDQSEAVLDLFGEILFYRAGAGLTRGAAI